MKKRLPEKIKSSRAKEKKQWLRGEIEGADSAQGKNKMHQGIIKCEKEK